MLPLAILIHPLGAISRLELTDDGSNNPEAANYYYFNELGGKIYRLTFCAAVPEELVPMGQLMDVSYDRIANGVMQSCAVPSRVPEAAQAAVDEEAADEAPRRRVLLGETITTPAQVRILVYIASFCGYGQPAVVTPRVRRRHRAASAGGRATLRGGGCVYGGQGTCPHAVR